MIHSDVPLWFILLLLPAVPLAFVMEYNHRKRNRGKEAQKHHGVK